MDIITSKDNIKIKYVRSLGAKKFRDLEDAFIVEGIKFVNEAVKEKANIKFILINEGALEKNEVKELLETLMSGSIENCYCMFKTCSYWFIYKHSFSCLKYRKSLFKVDASVIRLEQNIVDL